MTQLIPVQLDDGTLIYIEAIENTVPVQAETVHAEAETEEDEPEEKQRSGGKGFVQDTLKTIRQGSTSNSTEAQALQNFKAVQGTIRAYTTYTLNAFRNMAAAEVQKVSLEFGVNVSGVSGVPYIATGTVGCNLKINVECTFPPRPPVPSSSRPAAASALPMPDSAAANLAAPNLTAPNLTAPKQ